MENVNVPAGYKQTELGVLPEQWEVLSVEQVATVKGGKRLPLGKRLQDTPTPHPYIRIVDVYSGGVSTDDIKYVPADVFPAIRNYRIYKTDLFITVAGTLGLVGKIPEILDGANLTENADRLTNLKCDQNYLLSVFLSPIIQNAIEGEKTTGAQPKLALTRIKKLQIPLPPLPEQQAIANALGEMDALLAAQRARLAKQRAVKQGLLQTLLSGQQRLPGFAGEWQELSVKNDCTLHARIGWQGLTTNEYLEEGPYYLVGGTDFIDGRINWRTCFSVDKFRFDQDTKIQLRAGDILVTKDGTIGKVAFVDNLPKPATLNSGVFVLRPKRSAFLPLFLFYVLRSELFDRFIDQLTAGSTIVHLYQKDFVHFKFPAPSLDEQRAIAAVLSEADAALEALEAEHAKTQLLKQGLMQNLLTGKLRLPL